MCDHKVALDMSPSHDMDPFSFLLFSFMFAKYFWHGNGMITHANESISCSQEASPDCSLDLMRSAHPESQYLEVRLWIVWFLQMCKALLLV